MNFKTIVMQGLAMSFCRKIAEMRELRNFTFLTFTLLRTFILIEYTYGVSWIKFFW